MDNVAFEDRVSIVSAPFPAMRYIKNVRYLPGDSSLDAEKLNKPRKDSVQSLQRRSPSSPEGFNRFRISSAQA